LNGWKAAPGRSRHERRTGAPEIFSNPVQVRLAHMRVRERRGNDVSKRGMTIVAAMALIAGLGGPAFAKKDPAPATVCGLLDVAPGAIACFGFLSGNALGGSPADLAAQQSALGTLGLDLGLDALKSTAFATASNLKGATTIDFGNTLYGTSWFAVHFGNGEGGPGNGTAFYRIDAGSGLGSVTLNHAASSTATLFRTGSAPAPVFNDAPLGSVPEPASWAMMIGGLGAAGAMIRRRGTRTAALV
jgi:hypothetical protein